MSQVSKYPWLVAILILLAAARFIVVPIVQWQNDALEQLTQEQRRWDRAQRAINNVSVNQALLGKQQEQYGILKRLFFAPSTEATFKLEQQQWLEKLIEIHDFNITNIGWTYSASVLDSPLTKHALTVNLTGKTHNLPAFHLALESQPQWLEIVDFSFAIDGQRTGDLGNVRGSVVIQFYQLPEQSHSEALERG